MLWLCAAGFSSPSIENVTGAEWINLVKFDPQYLSTRGGAHSKSFKDVLMDGLAHDGGLYVPDAFPHCSGEFWESLKGLSYIDMAKRIIEQFVGDDMPAYDLRTILNQSYRHQPDYFRDEAITPLVKLDDNFHILELFHGPTLAFKDIALQFLGQVFDYFLAKDNKHITIVGATSGDTGSAAIEAVRHCKNVRIFMMHPKGRTSDIQRKQMTHIKADNVFNIAVEGSFDDCQNLVKDMFNDAEFRAFHSLSAVNSINWARIVAQTVYYAWAAVQLGAPHKQMRFAVPTGNFGNVYAAYVTKQMGLPIDQLIIGSNRNDILTRFFETGTMALTTVEPSYSPSMDIQISSNFERFLFDVMDRDCTKLNQFMTDFKTAGTASVSPAELAKAHEVFSAYRCDDAQTLDTIKDIYTKYNYLCDPHTAVGVRAALDHGIDADIPTVALACAHPAKFPDTVRKAVGFDPERPSILDHLMDAPEYYETLPADAGRIKAFINAQN